MWKKRPSLDLAQALPGLLLLTVAHFGSVPASQAQFRLPRPSSSLPGPVPPSPWGPDPPRDQVHLAQIWSRSTSRSSPLKPKARPTERPGPLSHRRSVPCLGPYPLLARAQSVQVLSSNFGAQVYVIKFSDSSCGTRSTLRPDPLWDQGHFTLCMYMHRTTLDSI